jgi:uncharacterized protein YoaH (UPF0181 family)
MMVEPEILRRARAMLAKGTFSAEAICEAAAFLRANLRSETQRT